MIANDITKLGTDAIAYLSTTSFSLNANQIFSMSFEHGAQKKLSV